MKQEKKRDSPRHLPESACSECWKPQELCICETIRACATRHRVLLLQHPRETRSPLGTASLASLYLNNSVHRIGLSWRSLSSALGEQTHPQHWAVLYLGTKKKSQNKGSQPINNNAEPAPVFQVVSAKGKPVDPREVRGVIILDGNWEQSKTLWWRNPWLLRLNRIQLRPEQLSLYGKLRRQPRKNCLSSLEAVATTLENLGEDKNVTSGLRDLMSQLLSRADALSSANRHPAPAS